MRRSIEGGKPASRRTLAAIISALRHTTGEDSPLSIALPLCSAIMEAVSSPRMASSTSGSPARASTARSASWWVLGSTPVTTKIAFPRSWKPARTSCASIPPMATRSGSRKPSASRAGRTGTRCTSARGTSSTAGRSGSSLTPAPRSSSRYRRRLDLHHPRPEGDRPRPGIRPDRRRAGTGRIRGADRCLRAGVL
jgi:hypothetical protein